MGLLKLLKQITGHQLTDHEMQVANSIRFEDDIWDRITHSRNPVQLVRLNPDGTYESIDRRPELKFESPNDADVKVTRGFYDEKGRLEERWIIRDSWADHWIYTTYSPPGSLIGRTKREYSTLAE